MLKITTSPASILLNINFLISIFELAFHLIFSEQFVGLNQIVFMIGFSFDDSAPEPLPRVKEEAEVSF